MSNFPTGLLKWTVEHCPEMDRVTGTGAQCGLDVVSSETVHESFTCESQIQTCEDKHASQGPDFTDVSLLGKCILLRS